MQNNKNILLIGGYNSLLGSKIYFYLGRKYKIFRTSRTRNIRLNLNNLQNIKKVLKKYKPNIIINCSAYTDVNGCEKNPIKAIKDNCLSNFNLCEVYDKLDIKNIGNLAFFYIFFDLTRFFNIIIGLSSFPLGKVSYLLCFYF